MLSNDREGTFFCLFIFLCIVQRFANPQIITCGFKYLDQLSHFWCVNTDANNDYLPQTLAVSGPALICIKEAPAQMRR